MNSENVVCSDCLEHMRTMPENSVDSIVTDPPYGLSFMNKEWDSFGTDTRQPGDEHYWVPDNPYGRQKVCYGWNQDKSKLAQSMVAFQESMTSIFAEALRVAKPGAHLLCFGGTRTFHRMACAIEDAGWEIRDCIMWVYGSGFPKSMDVGKAIDKHLRRDYVQAAIDLGMQIPGNSLHDWTKAEHSPSDKWWEEFKRFIPKQDWLKIERRVIGTKTKARGVGCGVGIPTMGADIQYNTFDITEPCSSMAKEWDGWGTCLKPAWEPIIVARKPLDGTVAHNVLTWGVGALNIDGCRVPSDNAPKPCMGNGYRAINDKNAEQGYRPNSYSSEKSEYVPDDKGRFPANLVHDGSQMVLDLFPESKGQQGDLTGNEPSKPAKNTYGEYDRHAFAKRGDSGSAARFFYCAKASKKDRNYGCERLLTWAERDQELTQLLEQASNLLARDISESMMLNLVEQGCSTSLFGNENTVLSQEECRFITSTVIPLITESRTCSSSPRSNTSESILDAIRTSEESGISLARLADKSSQSRQDSTSDGTDTATSAVSALFGVLSEIRGRARVGNFHCTVKPIALMRWLVTLVTPEGGVVLDPFAGSGTTLLACKELGRSCIGIEREPEYVEIIKRRLGE